ncbi:unnamed protein product [Rhodiola kirilowii]
MLREMIGRPTVHPTEIPRPADRVPDLPSVKSPGQPTVYPACIPRAPDRLPDPSSCKQ